MALFFTGSQWLIGQPFLSNFHMVFDGEADKVGFFGGYKYNFTSYTGDPFLFDWNSFFIFTLIALAGITVLVVVICYCYKQRQLRVAPQIQTNTYYQQSNNVF